MALNRWAAWIFLLAGCSEAGAPIAIADDAAVVAGADAAEVAPAPDAAFVPAADALTIADDAELVAADDAALMAPDAFVAPDAAVASSDAAVFAPDATVTSTIVVPRPVIFIHGIGGSSSEFAVMIERLVTDGWPRDYLTAIQFPDPRWGCNVDNATIIEQTVRDVIARTGQPRVDIVAHSMGVLSSRHYLKMLGGTAFVNTYVTLGGMHHGDRSACLNPLPVCVWQEICPTRPFLTALNDPPATPGPTTWVSIYSTDDDRVGNASSILMGAENIQVSGPVHAGPTGILESMVTYPDVLRVLRYAPW